MATNKKTNIDTEEKKKTDAKADVQKKSSASKAVKKQEPVVKKAVKPAEVESKKAAATPEAPKRDAEMNAVEKLAAELKKNAKWMAFVEKQRQKLLDLKDQILDNVSGVARDTLRNHPEGSEASASGEHTADAGSDAYDREFALSLLSQGQDSLYEIEDALERIRLGVYGICEICHKQIPQIRLEAIPFARLTVDCKAAWEKEHGAKSRFRPKRSGFGYSEGQIDLESSSVLLDEDEE